MNDESKPDETNEQIEQAQKPESQAPGAQAESIEEKQKPKMSKLAVLSIVCLVAACGVFVLYLGLGGLVIPLAVEKMILPAGVVALAVALVAGVIALVMIKASGGALAGRRLAMLGILVPIIVAVAYVRSSAPAEETQEPPSIRCRSNISRLAGEINNYRADNDGRLPKAEKWCDILLEQANVEESLFSCPLDEGARCSYSLNKYAAQAGADLPADMVLLFESKAGWNQVGGPELFIAPHRGRRGTTGCVAFADGKGDFITADNVDSLNWKGDKDSEEAEPDNAEPQAGNAEEK